SRVAKHLLTCASLRNFKMVLPYIVNSYADAVMHTKDLPRELVEESRFASEIIETFKAWKAGKLNGAWVHISLQDSHVVPHLAKLGFNFAHAATSEMTMTCWLSDKPSRLPPTTLSYYSVSGLVIDGTGRVLMVREQRRKFIWKFPGGMPEPYENLLETAERKVLEETGVVAKGEAVISLRQRLHTEYTGSCGFFFLCLMKYIRDANVGRVETVSDEIVDVRWFTRDEINSMKRHEFFDHHRNVWQAYLKTLEDVGGEELFEATEKDVTSKMFNFAFF
uniref:Nudix hydrolase domain-containing protein n=1 Tax=Haemonchus contortus TaxID=6289 RepID=A0A7I5EEV6_HAECO